MTLCTGENRAAAVDQKLDDKLVELGARSMRLAVVLVLERQINHRPDVSGNVRRRNAFLRRIISQIERLEPSGQGATK
jgi:hypothetical protein